MDWYRQTAWTDAIADEFEQRLSRSRSKRDEYLRIQAFTLVEQDIPQLAQAGIGLAKRQLELSPAGMFAAQMWATIAKGYATLEQPDEVVEAYRQSIRCEAETPNVRGYHYVDFAWYATTHSAVALYPEVLAAIEQNVQKNDLIFPATQYRFFGALALMAADNGDASEAKRMAQNAITAADRESGPFGWRPLIGLLRGGHDPIRTRLKRLAS